MGESSEEFEADGEHPDDAKYSDILLYSVVSITLLAAAVFIFVPSYRFDVILVYLGLIAGVVVAFYLYHSFSVPPRELMLPEGEELVKKNVEGEIYLTLPMAPGGFMGTVPPVKANLYLTTNALLAEPTDLSAFDEFGRYYLISVPLETILNFKAEKKLLAEYMRLTFTNTEGVPQELLFHTGDETGEWVEALSQMVS